MPGQKSDPTMSPNMANQMPPTTQDTQNIFASLSQLTQRASAIQVHLELEEKMLNEIQQQGGGELTRTEQQRVEKIIAGIDLKKGYLHKLSQRLQSIQSEEMMQQPLGGATGSAGANWMAASANPAQSDDDMDSTGPSSPQVGPGTPGEAMLAPSMADGSPINLVQSHRLAPLDRARFEPTYLQFCLKRGFQFNPEALQIGGRQIALANLHRIAMEEGGFNKIERTGTWDVVGAKLGFAVFPGSDGQPSRSGPGIALQVLGYYKEYLQAFDNAYLVSVLATRNKLSPPGTSPNDAHIIAFQITGYGPVPNATKDRAAGYSIT